MKIAIGIPSGDMVHADFTMSLVNLVQLTSAMGVQVAIINQKSSVIEIGRCELVRAAQGVQADALFMLDSDMTVHPRTILQLLDHGKFIVGCDAARRREPFTSVVKGFDGPLNHKKQKGLVEVLGLTTACLLIDMSVFDKIPGVPFKVTYNEEKKQFLGEDYYFSNVAREAGFKLFCDLDLSQYVGHIGTRTVYLPRR